MADKKGFFHNMFNNPEFFNFIRNVIDGGQENYIKKILKNIPNKSILDIACGTGKFSTVTKHEYLGIDYNHEFISYANKMYGSKKKKFTSINVNKLKLKKKFDLSMIINSIHHLDNKLVLKIFESMKKNSKIILIHDLIPRKNIFSKFFYSMDRGEHIRSQKEQEKLIILSGLNIVKKKTFMRFPYLYKHMTFICKPK